MNERKPYVISEACTYAIHGRGHENEKSLKIATDLAKEACELCNLNCTKRGLHIAMTDSDIDKIRNLKDHFNGVISSNGYRDDLCELVVKPHISKESDDAIFDQVDVPNTVGSKATAYRSAFKKKTGHWPEDTYIF